MKIAIAGAGIGGLTAALALLQRGFDVTVFEQASELKEVGAGVQIGANGSRVLFELGLGDAAVDIAVTASGKEIRLWNTGERWKLFDLGESSITRYGFPYLLMHRADLHTILAEAVRSHKSDAIRLNCRCVGFEQRGTVVQLFFEDGQIFQANVLVGADGLHSEVRRCLFGASQAAFTGGIAWRGIVPLNCLDARFSRSVGTNWIGPRGHVITYPVRRGELINFVGHVERDDWQIESWISEGSLAEMRADFVGWHPDVQELISNIETPFKWALFLREPLPSWGNGNVTLLGDACHATLPYLAQGANMAIEDGYILARCLNELREQPAYALSRYENARKERTSNVVRRSASNLGRFHSEQLMGPSAADYVSEEWAPEKVADRYDWLFSYDAVNVSI